MAEVVLEASGIHPLIRQGVATGMAEHVNVDGEGKSCGLACSLDQPGNALPLERITALVDEHIPTIAWDAA